MIEEIRVGDFASYQAIVSQLESFDPCENSPDYSLCRHTLAFVNSRIDNASADIQHERETLGSVGLLFKDAMDWVTGKKEECWKNVTRNIVSKCVTVAYDGKEYSQLYDTVSSCIFKDTPDNGNAWEAVYKLLKTRDVISGTCVVRLALASHDTVNHGLAESKEQNAMLNASIRDYRNENERLLKNITDANSMEMGLKQCESSKKDIHSDYTRCEGERRSFVIDASKCSGSNERLKEDFQAMQQNLEASNEKKMKLRTDLEKCQTSWICSKRSIGTGFIIGVIVVCLAIIVNGMKAYRKASVSDDERTKQPCVPDDDRSRQPRMCEKCNVRPVREIGKKLCEYCMRKSNR